MADQSELPDGPECDELGTARIDMTFNVVLRPAEPGATPACWLWPRKIPEMEDNPHTCRFFLALSPEGDIVEGDRNPIPKCTGTPI